MEARGAAALKAGTTALLVCGIDQAVKSIVRSQLQVGDVHELFGPVSLVSVRNEGVAFGALAGGGLLLVAFVALALSALLVVFVRTADRPGVWLATGLVLGGAVGNVIDRIAYGAVTDFVKISRWPAFNVADMAIVVGAVLLVWLTERGSSSVTEEG
jgi:signal peptidase II